MKATILALSTALFLSACAGGHDSNDNAGSHIGGVSSQMSKVTTINECQGGRATALTDAFSGWHTVFQAPRMIFTLNFQFDRFGQLTMTNNCHFDGIGDLSATAHSTYRDSGSSFEILAAAHDEEQGGGMTCNVNVAQATVAYGFEGRCLVLNDPKAGKLYLLPN